LADQSKVGQLSVMDVKHREKDTRAKPMARHPRSHNEIEVSSVVTNSVRKRGLSSTWDSVRFLMSKAVYEPTEITIKDLFVLDHQFERLLAVRDYSWNLKYRKMLLHASNNFSLVRSILDGKLSASNGLKTILNFSSGGFLLSAHAYFGRRKSFRISRWFVRENKRLLSKPRPQRFVGVGYRDHGTCRVPSNDASPSWQEVASSNVESPKREFPDCVRFCDQFTYSHFERKLVPSTAWSIR